MTVRGGVLRAAIATVAALAATAAVAPPASAEAALRRFEWWFDAYQVERIWGTTRGAGITVAVLDSGVNASIPDLSGVVRPGGDVLGRGTDGRTDIDTRTKGHGTSMAALIAGQGRSQILGIAPDARILPVLMNSPGADDPRSTYPAGIRFAADHGAKVISMSQSADATGIANGCPSEVQDAVKYAIDRDAVIVASAGNEGDSSNVPQFPAACAGVLSIGAVDSQRRPWSGSQRQPYVDFAGPGVDIVSVSSQGGGTRGTGTSPATALVSGAIALIRAAHPDLDAREVVARVIATAGDVGPAGRDDTTGIGVVRPFQGITATVPRDAPNPIFDELDAVAAPPSSQPTQSGPAEQPPSGAAPPPGGEAAGDGSGDSGDSGGGFPVGYVVVVSLAAAAFVVSTVVRRRRTRPVLPATGAGGSGVGGAAGPWPGGPPPQGPPPPQWPPGQQGPPSPGP